MFDSSTIRDIAVEAVSNYVGKGIDLNTSLADISERLKLNPEQIKRAVEVTNQVCYLKLRETEADKTFEFPLAQYEDVLAIVTSPSSLSKQAADMTTSLVDRISGHFATSVELEKSATEVVDERAAMEKKASLGSEFMGIVRELEKIAGEKEVLAEIIPQKLLTLGQDSQFLAKLACAADDQTYTELSTLFGKIDMVKEQTAGVLYKQADVAGAAGLVDDWTRAKELVEKCASLHERAKEINEELKLPAIAMDKVAFLATGVGMLERGIGKGVGMVGKGVGRATNMLGRTAKATGKVAIAPVAVGVSGLGTASRVTQTGMKRIGKAVGGALAGTAIAREAGIFKNEVINNFTPTGVAIEGLQASAFTHKNKVWDSLNS